MARKSSAELDKAIEAEAEEFRVAVANGEVPQSRLDAPIGSIGQEGREVTPFDDIVDLENRRGQLIGETDGPPTREERLQELDARGDALNGQHLVRPSERCGVLAGNGPYAGRRCTYAEHRSDAPHSWEVAAEPPSEQPGHVYDDTAQPTLPGTPEPEQNDYTVPTEASFGKAKLSPAHGLRAIGDRLIAEDDNLEHLRGIEIRYAWRRRGGTAGGNRRFARIKRPSVWEHFLTGGKPEFLVDLSADHCREFRFTERQIEAALYEQLVRTERDEDDHDAFRINGPDFSGSIATIDRYGMWRDDLREMHAHVAKLPLEEAIDQADAEDADNGEDDSE